MVAERIAEAGQGRADHLPGRQIGRVLAPPEVADAVIVDQVDPVIGGRRLPVALPKTGAGRRGQRAAEAVAERRLRQPGLGRLQLVPADLDPGLGPSLDEPGAEPVEEGDRAKAGVEEGRHQLLEAGALALDEIGLVTERGGQVGELLVGREVSLLDHGRGGHLEVGPAEEFVVERRLLEVELRGRGRRQAEQEDAVAQLVNHGSEQITPHLEQVVTLVQDQRPLATAGDPLDQSAAIRMEHCQQLLALAALGGHQTELAAEVGRDIPVAAVARLELGHLLLQVRAVRIDVADGLVGEGGEVGVERGIEPGADRRRTEAPPLLDPLALDRRVGSEADGPVAEPAGDLEAEHRLARAGWHHDVGLPAPRGPRHLEGVEREALIAAEGSLVSHRREKLGQLTGW